MNAITIVSSHVQHKSATVDVAALRSTAMLVSIVAPDVIIKQQFEQTLPKLVALLDSSTSADVLVACADVIALFFDMWRDAAELDDVEFNINDCTVVDVAALALRLRQLSHSLASHNARHQVFVLFVFGLFSFQIQISRISVVVINSD